jgi:hypothetical protein
MSVKENFISADTREYCFVGRFESGALPARRSVILLWQVQKKEGPQFNGTSLAPHEVEKSSRNKYLSR